jgi:hypothetical protein
MLYFLEIEFEWDAGAQDGTRTLTPYGVKTRIHASHTPQSLSYNLSYNGLS